MPSALKKLKSDLHTRRTSKLKREPPQSFQKASKPSKALSNGFRKQETPAQKAYRLRTETLLPELQRRNKAGGVIDRRIGENDPTLAPEDRMLQRYAAEGQRKRKADVFDLEDEDGGGEETLTHMGWPLNEGNRLERLARMKEGREREQEDEALVEGSGLFARSKRKLEDAIDEVTRAHKADGDDGEPLQKKSKTEVMHEVMAKSKFYKHERQAAKEDYEDKREELDKQLPDLLALLGGRPSRIPPINPNGIVESRINGVVQINGDRKEHANKTYDQRVRQMVQDQRAKPTTRTKTEEEQAEEQAAHLRQLEEDRQRRMRGEIEVNNDESDESTDKADQGDDVDENEDADEAAQFGSKTATPSKQGRDVEDEDEFLIDEFLIASGSDVDVEPSDQEDSAESDSGASNSDKARLALADEDDEDFLKDVLPTTKPATGNSNQPSQSHGSLAYTYSCPQNHSELLDVLQPVSYDDLPTVIQRIRALYHPSLADGNKDKLAAFGCTLVDYIPHLTVITPVPPLTTIEQVIRHIHSLCKAQPLPISHKFREHLQRVHEAASAARPGAGKWLDPGDLTILTAIGTIYPTSDHFHQVVTPAITIMCRWLGTTVAPPPQDVKTSRLGAYLVALVLRYQRLSRRYVPEAIRFTGNTLEKLAAAISQNIIALDDPILKVATQHIRNLASLADLYASKTAFIDIFSPHASATLTRLSKLASPLQPDARTACTHLSHLLPEARLARRPLQLHHHRPRAIRTAIPLFDEHFNPTKHYDPDTMRSETQKLRKEHRQEKKAATRELRKDAEFIARQRLTEKKDRDRAYEDKFRRIIGGIEREEGHGRKEYEREKESRKRARKGR